MPAPFRHSLAILLVPAFVACSAASPRSADSASGLVTYLGVGNADAGRDLIGHFGCGACHVVPGATDANSHIGPSLAHVGSRTFVGGMVANTPDELVRWLMNPQAIKPGTAMPNFGLSRRDASDIAAYLYTLR